MASPAELASPNANSIPTKAVAVDQTGGTDHTFDTQTGSKPTLVPYARRIFVGTGGDLVVRWYGASSDVTYKVQAGQYITGCFIKVELTGTTAANMIAEQ